MADAAAGTIAMLMPSDVDEVQYRRLKNSVRMHGSYLLTMRRPSRTPEASRKYVHGDPVAMIDWRAFARTDQLIIRNKRDTATARFEIHIDATETMRWPDQGTQKFEVALRVACNLAFGHLRVGDFVTLALNHESGQFFLKPRSPADVLNLYQIASESEFRDVAILQQYFSAPDSGVPADSLILVSDCLADNAFAPLAREPKHVVLMHLLSALEDNIDWIEASACYFDLGRGKKEYQGEALLRGSYDSGLRRWQARVRQRLDQLGGQYFYLTDKMPVQTFHGILSAMERAS
jgi:hypothetical protein